MRQDRTMTDDPGGGAGAAGRPAGRAADPAAELARRARDRRLELLTEHTSLDEDLDALDDERFDRIMALTDEVLDLERRAERAAVEAEHRSDAHAVHLATAILGAGAAALLLIGLPLGWWGGWGSALLGLDVAVAAVLAAAHAGARWTGRAVTPAAARAALGVGAVVAALAPDWAPWWSRVAGALALLGVAAAALTVFAVPAGEE
jgi:hypothetical protein